jgi:hypothetical protein
MVPGERLHPLTGRGRQAATEELIRAVGLNPAYVGDASARGTVDGVLTLWFALMQQRGGNRRLAFRVLQ